jgi:DNA-binding transcriptional MerR regulator
LGYVIINQEGTNTMLDNDVTAQSYSTSQVAQMSGFTVRQISYWSRKGIISPSVRQAHGSGTRRRYGFNDLLQLRFVRQLMNHGWSLQKIREAITRLREVMDDPDSLQKAVLVHGAQTILAICKTKEGEHVILDILDPGGQQVMWVFLESLERETKEVAALAPEKVKSN